MIDIYAAILNHPEYSHLIHDVDFVVRNRGNGQAIEQWNCDLPLPTPDQLAQGWNNHLSTLYREKRAAEYPPIGDQLDAMWKLLDPAEGTEARAMKQKIQAIKEKYPKPHDTE